MACARCGFHIATDTTRIAATLSAPSGAPLYLDLVIHTSANAERTKSEWFCEPCMLSFLGLFGEIGQVMRIKSAEASSA